MNHDLSLALWAVGGALAGYLASGGRLWPRKMAQPEPGALPSCAHDMRWGTLKQEEVFDEKIASRVVRRFQMGTCKLCGSIKDREVSRQSICGLQAPQLPKDTDWESIDRQARAAMTDVIDKAKKG